MKPQLVLAAQLPSPFVLINKKKAALCGAPLPPTLIAASLILTLYKFLPEVNDK